MIDQFAVIELFQVPDGFLISFQNTVAGFTAMHFCQTMFPHKAAHIPQLIILCNIGEDKRDHNLI